MHTLFQQIYLEKSSINLVVITVKFKTICQVNKLKSNESTNHNVIIMRFDNILQYHCLL